VSARIDAMQRFALAIVVALLTFSASGVSALAIGEPCSPYEQPGREDSSCPPTCVTCGCCVHAIEPMTLQVVLSPDLPVAEVHAFIPRLLATRAHDILHVPKLRLA